MKWDSSPNGGFTEGTPWIRAFPDQYNADEESRDSGSVLCFYKKLILLRKAHSELIYGDFTLLKTARELFAYERGGRFCVVMNLSAAPRKISGKLIRGKLLLCNYENSGEYLEAYEARVYRI